MVGLPRDIVKKYGISKAGWAAFRARRGGSTKLRVPKQKTKRKRSVTKMARRRSYSRKRRSRGPNAISKFLRRIGGWFKSGIKLAALIGPAGASVAAHGFTINALGDATQKYTGINVTTSEFAPQRLIEGWGPPLVTVMVLKLLNALGV